MKPKLKHYPDLALTRRQLTQSADALMELCELGIKVLTVLFRSDCEAPVIQVAHCPNTKRIASGLKSRGCGKDGKLYVRRVAIIKGCVVEWEEQA